MRRLKYFNFLMNKQELFSTCMMLDLMCPSDHVTINMPVGFKQNTKKLNKIFLFCSLHAICLIEVRTLVTQMLHIYLKLKLLRLSVS